MSVWKYHVVFLSCLVTGSCVTLENLTSTEVVENDELQFKCLPSKNITLHVAWWKMGNIVASTSLSNDDCVATGFLINETDYGYDCLENNVFTILLKNVSHNLDGTNVSCQFVFISSKNITIHVKVPVKSVKMDQNDANITVPENETFTLTCRTAHSRPEAYITWFIQDLSFTRVLNITSSSNQTTDDIINDVISSKSELSIKPTRSINGWKIYCSAANMPEQSVQSSKITLNVLYPPDGPPKISSKTYGDIYTLIEGNIGNLSCYITGGNPVPTLTWDCFNSSILHVGNATTVSSTVTWITQRGQNSCSCFSYHRMRNQSASLRFTVLYPPSKPILTVSNVSAPDVINVIRYRALKVSCSSNGNPTPKYSWSKYDTSAQLKINNNRDLHIDNMTADGHYLCKVSNLMKDSANNTETGINTSNFHVEVLYPPDQFNFTYGSRSGPFIPINVIHVIQGDSFSVSCNANGKPDPNYTWDNEKTHHLLNITSIQKISNRTCNMTNTMTETFGTSEQGNLSAVLFIDTQYPPTLPEILFTNSFTKQHLEQDSVAVIEGDSFNLTCTSRSRPDPSYEWSFNLGKESANKVLVLNDIHRNQNGKYTCRVSNIMNPTFRNKTNGQNLTWTYISVLFSAGIGKIPDRSIVEGLSLNVSCPVIPGNTTFTSVYWSRDNDTMHWNQAELFKYKITRIDAQNYTCAVKSELYPTFGNQAINYAKKSFYLNVLYKASVKRFLLNDLENKTHLATQSTLVSFTCEIDSNPSSIVSLTFPNGTSYSKPDTKFLKYSLLLTSCLDSGDYSCSGSNNYNEGQPGISLIQLLVNCHPIADGDFKREKRSKLNVPVTLHFKALAYPLPSFTWEIWRDISWQSVTNNTKFSVLTLELQTSLKISNFTLNQNEFRVNVTNFVGSFIQRFTVLPFDRPAKPSEFGYLLLTDTYIILSWNPGFNGGTPQNFSIEYESKKNYNRTILIVHDTEEQQMNLTIDGLSSSTFYKFQIIAVNSEGRSDTSTINVTTKASETIEVSQESNAFVRLIAGSTVGVIAFAGGIVFGVLFYRKRYLLKKKTESGILLYQNVPFSNIDKPKSDKTPAKKEAAFHPLQELDDTPPEYNELTEYYHFSEKIEQMEKIRVPELFQYVSGRTEETFAAEYLKLPTGLQKPCTFARKPENITRNRYNGIYPYDHSRVRISGQPDFYINACYIHGYTRQNEFIASLGPTMKVTDNYKTFWMMVWNEQSDIIVMLTNLQEPSGMKCEQYWPDFGTSIICGDVQVTCDREDVNAEYTARLLTVSNGQEQRIVTHLHYTAWPDKKVPEDVTTLIEFRERIRATPSNKKGPIIVHCSNGSGQTGTFLALERLIEEGQCESAVDVFKCVSDMREQRVKMVQTKEQYIYIYKALVNRLFCKCEMIPVESFQKYVSMTNNTFYYKQYQQLKETVETCSKEEADARAANTSVLHKNRHGADIPGCQHRIRMYLDRQMNESDYINAVYINSFKKKNHFISAQSPLPETVSDFVCMLYQEKCCCVVTMEDVKESGMTVGRYIPSDGSTLQFGRFEVSSRTLEIKAQYTVTEMKIKHSGQYESGKEVVYHFQYNRWMPGSDVPSDAKEFLQFIREVEEYANQLGEENSHVLVHCLKANERSGLYCIVAILMEKIRYERQVSISNTVRHFRTRRRTALTSTEQLKFCYNAVSAYINMYES